MKKKIISALLFLFLSLTMVVTLASCASQFAEAPQGLSEDARTFKEIKDKRMDAVAPDYKGYIYKKDNDAFCFRLKSPKNIQENKTYPIIIFLHGMGDWGANNSSHMYKSLIDNVAKFVGDDVYVFMPQAIKKRNWENDSKDMLGMNVLYNLALDELIKTKAVDTDRLYLTGMSMGGYGTFFQAYTHIGKYAAIAPICGYYPENVFSDLSAIKNLPIYMGHSKTDNTVTFSASENMYNRLIAAGAKDVQKLWLDDYKHDMTQPFYEKAEFWPWLMSKSK